MAVRAAKVVQNGRVVGIGIEGQCSRAFGILTSREGWRSKHCKQVNEKVTVPGDVLTGRI